MDVLNRDELDIEVESAPVFDLEQLVELVAADEKHRFSGECTIHEGCRPV